METSIVLCALCVLIHCVYKSLSNVDILSVMHSLTFHYDSIHHFFPEERKYDWIFKMLAGSALSLCMAKYKSKALGPVKCPSGDAMEKKNPAATYSAHSANLLQAEHLRWVSLLDTFPL